MDLYSNNHEFYCGIDLHSNAMYACVVDADGNKRMHKNFHTRDTETFLQKIKPFRNGVVIGCECTFNWYWLADLCDEKGIPFVVVKSVLVFGVFCTYQDETELLVAGCGH